LAHILDVPQRVPREEQEICPLSGFERPTVLLETERAGGGLCRRPDRLERREAGLDVQVHLDRNAEAREGHMSVPSAIGTPAA